MSEVSHMTSESVGEWSNGEGDVMTCVPGPDPFGRPAFHAITRRAPHIGGISVTKTTPVASVEEFIEYATARGFTRDFERVFEADAVASS
jgi:hypothetical protein